mgnify:CR=1 FL=1
MLLYQKLILRPIKGLRIIYIILVSSVVSVLENSQGRLLLQETLATLFFLLFLFSLYCLLFIGCAIDDTCAAAQGL